jgi:uncharacterized protein
MSSTQPKFVWYELMTSDADAAIEFYAATIGWTAKDAGFTDRSYTIFHTGETPIVGLMALPQAARDRGARPGWIGDIGVADVDATAARIVDLGGGIHRPAEDIPGVGRFAVVHDPQGAVFVIFAPRPGMQEPPPPAPFAPGHVGWHELHAAELESGFAFYATLFGWTKAEAIDMGPMGTYQLFAIGGTTVGGMMTKNASVPAPYWLYYVNIDAIDAAVARIKAAGGEVLHGPMQVPGGSWIAQCLDPQGAIFAVVAPVR